ncbi:hypothetical protein P8452_58085 [Trifolium repens]|nr:hypothetical protein P8452_58085 [Trifolium repens]
MLPISNTHEQRRRTGRKKRKRNRGVGGGGNSGGHHNPNETWIGFSFSSSSSFSQFHIRSILSSTFLTVYIALKSHPSSTRCLENQNIFMSLSLTTMSINITMT